MKKIISILFACSFMINVVGQVEQPDADMIKKIRDEGLNRSQVMDIAFYLTDVNGPRLQGSPGYTKAANWSKDKLAGWGLVNASLQPWGEWGKGWELQRSYIAFTAPYYKPIIAYPKSWTKGTNGLKQAGIVLINAKDSTDLLRYSGKLKGMIVIPSTALSLTQSFEPDARRMPEETLKRMGAPDSAQRTERSAATQRSRPILAMSANMIKEFAMKEGAIAILSAGARGKDGTLFVSGGGSYAANAPENFTDIVVALEDYNTIQRLAEKNIPVKLELDIKVKWYTNDTKGYNVIAEIPGTDPTLSKELVMLGGHLDSWHSSTGATDNAAGCAVMMEAVRILKTLKVAPRRTIRIALWGGEEQGLHGSRNYVRNHFMDTGTRRGNRLSENVSVYFNLDNGTGKIRGVYLQNNAGVKDLFTRWLEPFNDLGAGTAAMQNTGGTDHLAFDAVGIPGFQFIQDPIEYNTRTHHTNMDSYDHLIADDLKQAATIMASFIYNAAMRDEKIPRKAL